MPATQSKMYNSVQCVLTAVSKQVRSGLSEPEIARQNVHSKSIASLGYDQTRQCLQIEYNNGILYRIDDVSMQKYHLLRDADDFDLTFQQEIFAHHPMTRIGFGVPVYG